MEKRESERDSEDSASGTLSPMPEGFHPPLEEYLEAIHELGEEGRSVIQARLAERLDHSAPAVSEMIKRLRDEGSRSPGPVPAHSPRRAASVAESVVASTGSPSGC